MSTGCSGLWRLRKYGYGAIRATCGQVRTGKLNISRAIRGDALVFIACFSRASLSKDSSFQNEELLLAIDQLRLRPPDHPWLIPVRFDGCDIPDRDVGGGRTLASIHRASASDRQESG